MAQKAHENINKLKQLALLVERVKILRFLFWGYAILCFVFWFLNCFEVDWLYMFNWLFIGPYKILANYYRPKGISIDFSLAILGVIFGGIGYGLNYVLDYFSSNLGIQIIEEERKEKERIRRQREKNLKRQQISHRKENIPVVQQKTENPKLLFLISPQVNKIKKNDNDFELTFQEVEMWKQSVNKKLIENVLYSKPMQKGYYRKNLFLMYQDFNYVDEFVYYIKPTLDRIIAEFAQQGISISFSYVLSALLMMSNLEKELDCMDTVLSLNLLNQCVVTNRFRINYQNQDMRKFAISALGEYNLSKNLAISNRQPLFVLKNLGNRTQMNNKEN